MILADSLHLAMAGNGSPRRILTPLRQKLIYELFRHASTVEVGYTLDMAEEEVKRELKQLELARFVVERNGVYAPTFLVVSESEAININERAKATAAFQVEYLAKHWSKLTKPLCNSEGKAIDLQELSFMFIGDMLLDQGLLDALARDGRLMPPMPARPTADYPDARYYMWLIEGKPDILGRYGQRATALAEQNWYFVTFGVNSLDGKEHTVKDIVRARNARGDLAALRTDP